MFYQKIFRKTAVAFPLAAGLLFVFSVVGAPAMEQESPEFEIGEVIYENPLSSPEDVEDWVIESSKEGHPAITFPHDRMRLESDVHCLFWCPKDFPDNIAVSWDFLPRKDNGLAMFFIAATGKGGRDLFDPALEERNGNYSQYRKGDINALHVSYFRRNRHVRPFQIVSARKSTVKGGSPVIKRKPDPIASARTALGTHENAQPYRMQVIKHGRYFRFSIYDHVNNRNMTIFEWKDDGEAGPIQEGGKIGFRQMAGLVADYNNLEVRKVSLKENE